jgi:hypothetical protein
MKLALPTSQRTEVAQAHLFDALNLYDDKVAERR